MTASQAIHQELHRLTAVLRQRGKSDEAARLAAIGLVEQQMSLVRVRAAISVRPLRARERRVSR